MTNIAVFLSHYTLDNSPSLLNILGFLSRNFTHVDLYHRSMDLLNTAFLKEKHICSIPIGYRKRALNYIFKALKARLTAYACCIAVDPHGFVLFKELCGGKRPIVYYSLELYLKNDHFGLNYPEPVMQRERACIAGISGLIIQSGEKESLFRQDYGLPEKIPSFLLPVTYKGPAKPEKSSFLHNKYNIPADKKLALHLGGIADWHGCIEIAQAFKDLPGWVLFFQGYPDPVYRQKLESLISLEKLSNTIVSTELYNDIEELAPVIMSCSIGIAWYKDISIGFRTAGRSSGKIPAYMRFGLPVIAKKYQSTIEAIAAPGCGLCIDVFQDLPQAVKTIETQYLRFAQAALQEYNKTYRFENYESQLTAFLLNNKSTLQRTSL
jgi:glycosyltransferase involved in cell wall biosynthesis